MCHDGVSTMKITSPKDIRRSVIADNKLDYIKNSHSEVFTLSSYTEQHDQLTESQSGLKRSIKMQIMKKLERLA